MNFEFPIDLPEHGSCIVEFAAFFDYMNGAWDASDPVMIHLSDEDEDVLEIGDLDVSSQLIVISAVEEALEEAKPSREEIHSTVMMIKGEHDGDCDRDES